MCNLIGWLPPEAALWRSAGTSWDVKTELAANTVELLDSLLIAFVQANSKKRKKMEPIKIPRPWTADVSRKSGGTTLGELLGKSGMRVITSEG